MATFELTLISATLSTDVQFNTEPKDVYATVKFGWEQQTTKRALDHGRSPVWNETIVFVTKDEEFPKFIFIQLFAVQTDADELLGVARVPVPSAGGIECCLFVLVSPSKGEIGTLKATGQWKSTGQQSESQASFAGKEMASGSRASYPYTASPYDEVTGALSNLAVSKGQGKKQYPSPAHETIVPVAYPPKNLVEERSIHTSAPYPPPSNVSQGSYPPASAYPPKNLVEERSIHKSTPYSPSNASQGSYPPASAYPPLDASQGSYPPTSAYPPYAHPYPPHPAYKISSSSADQPYLSRDTEENVSPSMSSRGLGDHVDKGYHSHVAHGYPPAPMYGGGYPSPPGYAPGPPPAGGYPPPPAYPPAAHNFPPSPYAYPPVANPYSQHYPPYGYPPPVPFPVHPGHGSYAPGMYMGHSSSGKHSKHYKHPKMKMAKHSMYNYGHAPHYSMHGHHYKHKKHKMFGKGLKFKKFKGFKKFK